MTRLSPPPLPPPPPVIACRSRPKSLDSVYYGYGYYGYTIAPVECVHFNEYNADNVTSKTRVRTSENASEKHHYFALAFTGMNSVPSCLLKLWRQPVYTRVSVLHALSCACACTEKHPLTTVSVTRTW